MAKSKPKQYRVMVASITNDQTGARFTEGQTVTTDDFSYEIIKDWQMMTPPVLVDNDIYLASLPVEGK